MLQGEFRPFRRFCKALHKGLAILTLLLFCQISAAYSHETRPAVADITLSETEARLVIQFNAELFLANIDASQFANTDDAPNAAIYDQLRQLSPPDLHAAFAKKWQAFSDLLQAEADATPLLFSFVDINSQTGIDASLPRLSTLTITAPLPSTYNAVRFGWNARLGDLILRQMADASVDPTMLFTGYLKSGALSGPISQHGTNAPAITTMVGDYIKIGFIHIIPRGFDHILFVLGLFFYSARWRPLLAQVSIFTIAHSLTLALASSGVIVISANIVEPLIAASIAYVALENLLHQKLHKLRLMIIFIFGLLHGLGFASVLSEIGLPQSSFLISLISFNIGVECGQIAVITAAFAITALLPLEQNAYRRYVAMPASCVIGVIGIWMVVDRLAAIWL